MVVSTGITEDALFTLRAFQAAGAEIVIVTAKDKAVAVVSRKNPDSEGGIEVLADSGTRLSLGAALLAVESILTERIMNNVGDEPAQEKAEVGPLLPG